jgi:phenylacetate-coenzyme A ligase PaaK-like adenylate-forming protein
MNVLTIDPVEYFATSSGTTDKPKFIPITKQRYKDFIYEQILWTLNATRHNPKLFIDMIRGKILYFT